MRTTDAVRTRRGPTKAADNYRSDVERPKQARWGRFYFQVGEMLIWKRAKTEK